MSIPTEPIGSIPRPAALIDAIASSGGLDPGLDDLYEAAEIRDRILQASEYIPADRLGSTDDCGFSPFSDDRSTSRGKAFEKIRARVLGTALASDLIHGG